VTTDITSLAGTSVPLWTPARPTTDRDVDATLNRPPTTTPSFADGRATGNVPGLRPNPGMLRALLQPVLFLELLEPVGAFEVGDVVAAQFWGEGRVMLTPLPAEAARGRIPTTYPANQIHAEIRQPRLEPTRKPYRIEPDAAGPDGWDAAGPDYDPEAAKTGALSAAGAASGGQDA
jgi:hypothetical protein